MSNLTQRRRSADAAWRAEVNAEVERIVAIADPAERVKAFVDLSRVLAEEGETLPPETVARIAGAPAAAAVPPDRENLDDARAAQWAVERKRMAVLFVLRPYVAVGCIVAALVPFAVAVWRGGMDIGDVLATFVAPGRGVLGVALALVLAGVLASRVSRPNTVEGLIALLVTAFAAGVAGLAVGRGLPF